MGPGRFHTVMLAAAVGLTPSVANALIVVDQVAEIRVRADGETVTQSLPPGQPGSLFMELGQPQPSSEYAVASLLSSFSFGSVRLEVSTGTDHPGHDGLARSEITLQFQLLNAATYTRSYDAGALGGGWLGGLAYFRLSDDDGWILDLNVEDAICNDLHPRAVLACASTLPAGYYTLEAYAFSFYPIWCGSCHGYGWEASGFVQLSTFSGAILLQFDEEGLLSWNAVPNADGYDVLAGDLDWLRASGGDFTTATSDCLADDRIETWLTHTVDPAPGEGLWFLVRSETAGTHGSFDSGGSMQSGPRDVEIAASALGCP